MTNSAETTRMNHPSTLNEPEAVTACGGKISDPDRYPGALYRERQVHFCTRACLRAFEADPDRFMAGEIEHPTEEE